MRRAVLVAGAVLSASGCSRLGARSEPVAPQPVTAPEIQVEPVGYAGLGEVAYLSPPPVERYEDPILSSTVMRDPAFQESVEWWIDYWETAARPWFPDFLRRMGAFEQTVDSALAARAMPASLRSRSPEGPRLHPLTPTSRRSSNTGCVGEQGSGKTY